MEAIRHSRKNLSKYSPVVDSQSIRSVRRSSTTNSHPASLAIGVAVSTSSSKRARPHAIGTSTDQQVAVNAAWSAASGVKVRAKRRQSLDRSQRTLARSTACCVREASGAISGRSKITHSTKLAEPEALGEWPHVHLADDVEQPPFDHGR